jgi:glycosyltransferase involved in cell wall biosynthesis
MTMQGSGQLPTFRGLLYGMILAGLGLVLCLADSILQLVLILMPDADRLETFSRVMLFSSLLTIWIGLACALTDLFVLLPHKRRRRAVEQLQPISGGMTVVLTAYNDQLSIGEAVLDFRSHPLVQRVIVVDNNSTDRTKEVAEQAGALVLSESRQGYGHCVYRALCEGVKQADTSLTLLCEGDRTYRAYDIDKFMAYITHAEIVNGTRIVEQLRSRDTQLTTFMYYGNFFVGKLLEAKHIGHGTFTDVGTTYKLCRNSDLARLLPLLNPAINLEFNAHFLDTALQNGFRLVECPVTFHNRVGVSKGGNVSNSRAVKVGTRMIRGIVFGWRRSA